MARRLVVLVHRWLGVALCVLFLVWFSSAIGTIYCEFPSVTPGDRLERSRSLDPASIRLSPAEALAALGDTRPPTEVRLNIFDARPVYRFRVDGGERLVYADTGERPEHIAATLMDRAAAAWTRQPVSAARVEPIDVDQWTVQGSFRNLQPLWKYSWPNGEHVYVSQRSGEVVQYTTTRSRIAAYLGPIPHWLYFTPLRRHQRLWTRIVVWTSGGGAIAAVLGLIIGVWMYAPSRPYRYSGRPTSIPYRGQKRLHMIFGLTFGLTAATWAFSGMLSMDPFPQIGSNPSAGRGGDAEAIAQALAQPIRITDFVLHSPQRALARAAGEVKQLELREVDSEPVYLATLAGGGTRVIARDGTVRAGFDPQRIIKMVANAVSPSGLADVRLLNTYDRYYLDRRGRRPLPVILARLNDPQQTRYYIDLHTATLAGSYSARDWMARWLYHGLHSLDFPWLYTHRPLWDLLVIACMLGGMAISGTSLILAWRVLARTLGRQLTDRSSDENLMVR